MLHSVPHNLQSVLWSSNIKNLDLVVDKSYIIHQILAYGQLEDMKWLFSTYPRKTIVDTFTTTPYKDYRRARFYFVKDMIMGISHMPLSESLYVKNIPRDIR